VSEFRQCFIWRSGRCVDLERVPSVPVDSLCHSARQAGKSITSSSVSFLGHLGRAPDAHPHNVQTVERAGPIGPARPVDDHLVHNDVETDMSRCGYRALVRAEHLPTNATDVNARPFLRHFKTNPVGREWSAVGSCALPLARDLGQDIIDPDQEPEVASCRTLIAKRRCECRLPRARRAVQDHNSAPFLHGRIVPDPSSGVSLPAKATKRAGDAELRRSLPRDGVDPHATLMTGGAMGHEDFATVELSTSLDLRSDDAGFVVNTTTSSTKSDSCMWAFGECRRRRSGATSQSRRTLGGFTKTSRTTSERWSCRTPGSVRFTGMRLSGSSSAASRAAGLAGSSPVVALNVRGMEVLPGDLDLWVEDAEGVGRLFDDLLVEPVSQGSWRIATRFGRAFYELSSSGWRKSDPAIDNRPNEQGPTAASRLEAVNWENHTILVTPIDIQLEVSQYRGLHSRTAGIRNWMRTRSGARKRGATAAPSGPHNRAVPCSP
jgi:hypothetical protein